MTQSCGLLLAALCVGFFFVFIGFAGFHGIVIQFGFFILILIPAFRLIFRHGVLIVLDGASLVAAVIFFCRGFRFAVLAAPACRFLIAGYFLILVVFRAFRGFPAVLCLFFILGGSDRFEFFFRFFQRLFDQTDDEFLLGKEMCIRDRPDTLPRFKVFSMGTPSFTAISTFTTS